MVLDRNGLERVALLSGIAYLVMSTFSASEELGSQNADVTSGQLLFNNACRLCHSIREGDNRLGPHSARHHRKEGWVAAKLLVFQRYEGRKLGLGCGKPQALYREPRRDSARQHHETLRWFGIGGEQTKADRFLEDPCGRSIVALVLG